LSRTSSQIHNANQKRKLVSAIPKETKKYRFEHAWSTTAAGVTMKRQVATIAPPAPAAGSVTIAFYLLQLIHIAVRETRAFRG
jgi:hypothetical protein